MSNIPTTAEIEAQASRVRRALADAGYPPADEADLQTVATWLANWKGRVDGALGDPWDPRSIEVERVRQLLLRFDAALREAGHPELIAARLRRQAASADYSAEKQEGWAADYRKRGLDSMADASASVAADLRASAARLRAEADAVLVREAA